MLDSAKEACAGSPHEFPDHLVVALKDKSDDEPNRAFLALQDAARSTGGWVGDSAHAVGVGVGNAAEAVSRPFRSVDLDGDGIPDEAQALTAVKSAGGAVAGGAAAATRVFRKVDLDGDGIADEAQALTAAKVAGDRIVGGASAVFGKGASLFQRKKGQTATAAESVEVEVDTEIASE